MLLSIIVPIYNVAPYIARCFDSLYAQDLDESLYEIIAINDGTPDNSMSIVEKYAKIHPNLHVINQANLGVSCARNNGMEVAKGDYLLFVDADDWIAVDSLKKIYDYLSVNFFIEILILRSFVNGTEGIEKYSWKNRVDKNEFLLGMSLIQKGYLRGSVCGGIYKRDFLQEYKLAFPEGVVNGEDSILINLMFCFAKKIAFFDLPFYFICERIGSASRSFTKERVFLYKNNLEFINQYEKANLFLSDEQKMIIAYMKYSVISNAVYYYIYLGEVNASELKKRLILSSILPIKIKRNFMKGLFVKIKLLNISFYLYFICVFIMNIFKRIFLFMFCL